MVKKVKQVAELSAERAADILSKAAEHIYSLNRKKDIKGVTLSNWITQYAGNRTSPPITTAKLQIGDAVENITLKGWQPARAVNSASGYKGEPVILHKGNSGTVVDMMLSKQFKDPKSELLCQIVYLASQLFTGFLVSGESGLKGFVLDYMLKESGIKILEIALTIREGYPALTFSEKGINGAITAALDRYAEIAKVENTAGKRSPRIVRNFNF